MYLDYTEYNAMGGTLNATTFTDIYYQAESIIDWYTFNRLENDTVIPDKVKYLVYQLIKLLSVQQNLLSSSGSSNTGTSDNKVIVSQSNDGFSTTYNVMSTSDILSETDATSSRVKNLVKQYLQGVKNEAGKNLLYRGRYPDE